MSDRAAFIAAICDKPDDDLPRLVYADWLDGCGPNDCREPEPERAEVIRVQCELAAMNNYSDLVAAESVARATSGAGLLKKDGTIDKRRMPKTPTPNLERFAALRRREDELKRIVCNPHTLGDLLPGAHSAEYRRGFLHTIRCTAADWMRYGGSQPHYVTDQTVGQSILAQHPVERVYFDDGNSLAFYHLRPGNSWILSSTFHQPKWEFRSRSEMVTGMPRAIRQWGIPTLATNQIRCRAETPGIRIGSLVRFDPEIQSCVLDNIQPDGVVIDGPDAEGMVTVGRSGLATIRVTNSRRMYVGTSSY